MFFIGSVGSLRPFLFSLLLWLGLWHHVHSWLIQYAQGVISTVGW